MLKWFEYSSICFPDQKSNILCFEKLNQFALTVTKISFKNKVFAYQRSGNCNYAFNTLFLTYNYDRLYSIFHHHWLLLFQSAVLISNIKKHEHLEVKCFGVYWEFIRNGTLVQGLILIMHKLLIPLIIKLSMNIHRGGGQNGRARRNVSSSSQSHTEITTIYRLTMRTTWILAQMITHNSRYKDINESGRRVGDVVQSRMIFSQLGNPQKEG